MWRVVDDAYGQDKNIKTRQRVVTTFGEFMRLNALSCSSRALKLFIGQALNSGLKASTVHTYSRYVAKAFRGLVTDPAEWQRALSVIEMVHADSEATKALKIDVQLALTIIGRLRGDAAPMVAAILTTGCRCADIMRWRTHRLLFTSNSFAVHVHLSKNRRSPDKKVIHRIDDVKAFMGFEVPEVLRAITEHPRDSQPFAGWHTSRVNASLRAACRELGVQAATTYSFRRLFCLKALEKCGFDPEKAKRYTLHCRAEVLAAFYDQ